MSEVDPGSSGTYPVPRPSPPGMGPRPTPAGMGPRPAPPGPGAGLGPGPAYGPGSVHGAGPVPAGDTAVPPGGPTASTGPAASTGPTGHPLVDAALDELDRAAELPADAQVAAYEATHRVLQQTLATIDQA